MIPSSVMVDPEFINFNNLLEAEILSALSVFVTLLLNLVISPISPDLYSFDNSLYLSKALSSNPVLPSPRPPPEVPAQVPDPLGPFSGSLADLPPILPPLAAP